MTALYLPRYRRTFIKIQNITLFKKSDEEDKYEVVGSTFVTSYLYMYNRKNVSIPSNFKHLTYYRMAQVNHVLETVPTYNIIIGFNLLNRRSAG